MKKYGLICGSIIGICVILLVTIAYRQILAKGDVSVSKVVVAQEVESIRCWSGLSGEEIIYTSQKGIHEILNILDDEVLNYEGAEFEASGDGCIMVVEIETSDEIIHLVYGGCPFQYIKHEAINENNVGMISRHIDFEGAYYSIKNEALNIKDLHAYTGLVLPVGY